MNIIQKINNELNESQFSMKALKEKYQNFTKFYNNIYLFSVDVKNNKSRYERENALWGLYDLSSDTVILNPCQILTFGNVTKTLPHYVDFLGHKVIKIKNNGIENYYDIDDRKCIFENKYTSIEPIKDNKTSFKYIFEAEYNGHVCLIDKDNHTLYTYNKEYVGNINLVEHNNNLFAITSRYDEKEYTSIVNVTKKKTVLPFGKYSNVKLFNSYGNYEDWKLTNGGSMWLVLEDNKKYMSIINIDTGEIKACNNIFSKIFNTNIGVYGLIIDYDPNHRNHIVTIVNMFNKSEKYTIPNPYDKVEEMMVWYGTLYAFATEMSGSWNRAIFVLKNNTTSMVIDRLDFKYHMPEDPKDELCRIFTENPTEF